MIFRAMSGLFDMKVSAVFSSVFKTGEGDCSYCNDDVLDNENGHQKGPSHDHT